MQTLCYIHSKAHKNRLIRAPKQLVIGQLQNYRFDSCFLLIHTGVVAEPLLFALGEAAGPATGAANKLYFW